MVANGIYIGVDFLYMVAGDIFKGQENINKILIRNGGENAIDKTFFYLSGIEAGLFEGSSLVFTRDSLKLFVYPLEEELAKQSGHETVVANSISEMKEKVAKELSMESEVGVNLSSFTVEMFESVKSENPRLRFRDVSSSISEARMQKSTDEIKRLREAARISGEVYQAVLDSLKEGMQETEVAAMLVYRMMSEGASGPAFGTIVGFGENSAIPHYSAGRRKLKKGDFVLTDYGAQYRRYCADTTRTAVFGRATEEQKEIYSIVHEAQARSMELIKAGVNGRIVNQKALDIIDSTRYRGKMMHGLGHGIGLEVHDHSALGKADRELKENMVITDEPGIYVAGFGGVRIEDDVLVKRDGYERITHKPPSDLIEV